MPETSSFEDHLPLLAPHVEPGAPDAPRAECTREHLSQRITAHESLLGAVQRDLYRTPRLVSLEDFNAVEPAAHAGAGIAVEGLLHGRAAGLIAPRCMGVNGRAVIRAAYEVRTDGSAPHIRGGARAAAAVGVKDSERRRAVKPQYFGLGAANRVGSLRRPARAGQPPGLKELAMRPVTEVVALRRMPSKMGDGVRAPDDRLHLEHAFNGLRVACRWSKLRQDCGFDIAFERNGSYRELAAFRHAHTHERGCRGRAGWQAGPRHRARAGGGDSANRCQKDTRRRLHHRLIGTTGYRLSALSLSHGWPRLPRPIP